MNTEREGSRERAALRALLEHRVDGILLATSGGFEQPRRVPVVFFDNLVEGAGAGHVARANREGMSMLVEHLVGHGHRRIAYVGAPPVATSGVERLAGFEQAIEAAGLETPGRPDRARRGERHARARSDLGGARSPAARPGGRRSRVVRRPVLRRPHRPPITALARTERELGELAASLLLHALRTGRVGPPTEVRLPVELIVRRSCGCPGTA